MKPVLANTAHSENMRSVYSWSGSSNSSFSHIDLWLQILSALKCRQFSSGALALLNRMMLVSVCENSAYFFDPSQCSSRSEQHEVKSAVRNASMHIGLAHHLDDIRFIECKKCDIEESVYRLIAHVFSAAPIGQMAQICSQPYMEKLEALVSSWLNTIPGLDGELVVISEDDFVADHRIEEAFVEYRELQIKVENAGFVLVKDTDCSPNLDNLYFTTYDFIVDATARNKTPLLVTSKKSSDVMKKQSDLWNSLNNYDTAKNSTKTKGELYMSNTDSTINQEDLQESNQTSGWGNQPYFYATNPCFSPWEISGVVSEALNIKEFELIGLSNPDMDSRAILAYCFLSFGHGDVASFVKHMNYDSEDALRADADRGASFRSNKHQKSIHIVMTELAELYLQPYVFDNEPSDMAVGSPSYSDYSDNVINFPSGDVLLHHKTMKRRSFEEFIANLD